MTTVNVQSAYTPSIAVPVVPHPKNTATFNVWLDQWLYHVRPQTKESSYMRYKNLVDTHIRPRLGTLELSQITTSIMEEYITEKLYAGRINQSGGLSPKTVSDLLAVIKNSFRFIQTQGQDIPCAFSQLTVKKSMTHVHVLTHAEVQLLTSFLLKDPDCCKLGVLICLYTGIRIGELCALKWKHVSISETTLKIEQTMQRMQQELSVGSSKTRVVITSPKSFSAIRIIPLPEFLVPQLCKFQSDPEAFFLTGFTDSYIEPRTMQNHFQNYLKLCGIRHVNFHALRHTFATHCVELGFDLKTLSEILGHSSVKITLDKYVHSSMEQKRINMSKLKLTLPDQF